jgi:3-dehydroquinate synthase
VIINVAAADRSYQVIIETEIVDALVASFVPEARVALVIPETLASGALQNFVTELSTHVETTLILTPDGEGQKSVAVLESAWNQLGAAGFNRNDRIVGIGGGATTDLAGFLASSWLRGIDWSAVPTSLAGMVDAAVGGKTGINTASGKNLVGAFYSPTAVFISPRFLSSLPTADVAAGLAEVIKCGFIADPKILQLVAAAGPGTLTDAPLLEQLICRAVQVKADVVSQDFKESGLREILNYGHTLGHAIEKQERYSMRHGDAVSIGMVFAAELAHASGLISSEDVALHRTLLGSLGLPITYTGPWEVLRASMSIDKKSRAGMLRFVVLDALGSTRRLEGPNEEILKQAYERLQP